MKPIKPEEVDSKKIEYIDPIMIEVVNNLIIKHWNGDYAIINQNEIIDEYCKKANKKRGYVFEQKQLDFEPVYKDAGWNVTYDKPGFNENYESKFEFSRKK